MCDYQPRLGKENLNIKSLRPVKSLLYFVIKQYNIKSVFLKCYNINLKINKINYIGILVELLK